MNSVKVPTLVLPHAHDIGIPRRHSSQAAGVDLHAAIPQEAPIVLAPGQRCLVPTGVCISLPIGFEGQVRPRSGLALTRGITVLNSPGTIDSDYRGEIKVILINLGSEDFLIERGDRIAQMIVSPVILADFEATSTLDPSERSHHGFGSTGLNSGKTTG